mgnify:CR=1 FL=1
MGSVHAWPFMYPVDPEALQIPQYREVIKNPMDLTTVKTKYENGEYKDLDSFEKDVELIFDNAMIFNPRGSDIYVHADEMKSHFQHMKQRLRELQNSEKDLKKDELNKKVTELEKELEELKETEKKLQEEKKKVQEKEKNLPRIRSRGLSKKKLTYDEKRQIYEKYKDLPKEYAYGINIIISSSKFFSKVCYNPKF